MRGPAPVAGARFFATRPFFVCLPGGKRKDFAIGDEVPRRLLGDERAVWRMWRTDYIEARPPVQEKTATGA
jgi:hypothetical protein